jgi:hypothetical protein
MKTNFEILTLKSVSKGEFIHFWSEKYFNKLEYLYESNIGQFTDKSVLALFCWKSGTKENIRSPERLDIYFAALKKLRKPTSYGKAEEYIKKLDGGGAIWNIFWLHCLNPNLFPIFDQHTYRAMRQIKEGTNSEIPKNDDKKIRIYFEEYIPFVFDLLKLPQRAAELRQLDKALFIFGKCLKKCKRKGQFEEQGN